MLRSQWQMCSTDHSTYQSVWHCNMIEAPRHVNKSSVAYLHLAGRWRDEKPSHGPPPQQIKRCIRSSNQMQVHCMRCSIDCSTVHVSITNHAGRLLFDCARVHLLLCTCVELRFCVDANGCTHVFACLLAGFIGRCVCVCARPWVLIYPPLFFVDLFVRVRVHWILSNVRSLSPTCSDA